MQRAELEEIVKKILTSDELKKFSDRVDRLDRRLSSLERELDRRDKKRRMDKNWPLRKR